MNHDETKDEHGGDFALLRDPEACSLLAIGPTRLAELEREPDFPRPIWLGARGKRHIRTELIAFAMRRRGKPEATHAE